MFAVCCLLKIMQEICREIREWIRHGLHAQVARSMLGMCFATKGALPPPRPTHPAPLCPVSHAPWVRSARQGIRAPGARRRGGSGGGGWALFRVPRLRLATSTLLFKTS
jgi:hypothetical protein